MKLHIGMPVYGGVHPRVVSSLLDFDIGWQKERTEMTIQMPRGSLISHSRNLIMRTALQNEADWLLMWDADTEIIDRNFLMQIIEASKYFEAAVIGLAVRLKDGKTYNCAVKKGKRYINRRKIWEIEPFEIDVVGSGVMLINLAWVREYWTKGPWFSIIDTESGCFPEDWSFCEGVKERGGKIIVDPRFKTKHWGEFAYE